VTRKGGADCKLLQNAPLNCPRALRLSLGVGRCRFSEV